MFSVTVFAALLGNIFQQWTSSLPGLTFLQASGHLTPNSYSYNCGLGRFLLVFASTFIHIFIALEIHDRDFLYLIDKCMFRNGAKQETSRSRRHAE
jgi:hypothetical protein